MIHLLPQLWLRNTWPWKADAKKPLTREQDGSIVAEHGELGTSRFFADSLASVHYNYFSAITKRMRAAFMVEQTLKVSSRTASTNTWFTAINRG